MYTSRIALAAALGSLLLLCLAAPATAQNSRQGVIYAPIYHEAIIDHRGRHLDLAATVYVRNLSRKHPVTIEAVTMMDGKGKAGLQCLQGNKQLAPLATLRLLPTDCPPNKGEFSVLVRWSAPQPVPPPLVEVLMMGTAGQQGISLSTRGVPLEPEP
ncbi:MAG: DUF3124 domain-containing protein [Deltaproteobacteria bacterium]|nr:DUF3124 domain-containing protein [Deltaproteobacteria bacterium]